MCRVAGLFSPLGLDDTFGGAVETPQSVLRVRRLWNSTDRYGKHDPEDS
jgi:hypothetical protein